MDHESVLILNVGLFLLWFSFLICICRIAVWLYVDRVGIIYSIRRWTEEEKNNVITLYFYLISSYCLTLISSMYFFSSPLLLTVLNYGRAKIIMGTLLATALLTHHQEVIPYDNRNKEKKNWIWFFQTILIGPSLTYFGPTVFTKSIFDTLLAIFVSTLFAFSAPLNYFEELTPYVNFLYSAVLISSALNFLFVPPVTPFSIFLLVQDFLAGTILYFLVFAVNTQYMLQEARIKPGDPINDATVMYLCTINLYVRMSMRYLLAEI